MYDIIDVVGAIGQLGMHRKHYELGKITARELTHIGAYKLGDELGLSRYRTMALMEKCAMLGFVKITERIHRKWINAEGKNCTLHKECYEITSDGMKELDRWVEIDRYKECVARIVDNHRMKQQAELRSKRRALFDYWVADNPLFEEK